MTRNPSRASGRVALPVAHPISRSRDGGASPVWQRNAVRALAELLPDAQRRTLEGQTHMVPPEVLAPVLEEFFSG